MRRDGRAARAFVMAVLLLAVRTPLAQQAPPGNPDAYPPFLAGGFSHERLGRWLAAVRAHEPGTTDEFLRTIAAWPLGDLIGAPADFAELRRTLRGGGRRGPSARVPGCKCTVKEFLQSVGVTPEEAAGGDILERAAVLHTEVLIAITTESVRPDWATGIRRVAWHNAAAWTCVRLLARDAPRDPFVHQWYLSLAAFLGSSHELLMSLPFVEEALKLFPSDRELLMTSACIHEYLASPRLQEGIDIRPPVGDANAHLRQAEKTFRQAMGAGLSSPELSMRLGRVLGLSGRHDEALSILKPALDISTDERFRSFIDLFIGDEEAALGHDDPAQLAYLRARTTFPAQPAYLASSRLALEGGDKAAAAAVLRSMFAMDSARVDPWPEYYSAGRREQADRLLVDLRAPFRKARAQ